MMDHAHGWPGPRGPMRGLRIAGMAVLGVVGAGLFALAFGWAVMLLWNWLMPAIFGLGTIGYWQAFGIVVLAKLLFGRVGGAHMGRRPGGHWKGNPWEGRHGEGHGERHGRDDWRWFRDFWDREGRASFEQFRDRMRAARDAAHGGGTDAPKDPAGSGPEGDRA
jgi:hypothetical protein